MNTSGLLYAGALSRAHFDVVIKLALVAEGVNVAETETNGAEVLEQNIAGNSCFARLAASLSPEAAESLRSNKDLVRYLGFGAVSARELRIIVNSGTRSRNLDGEYFGALLNTIFVLYDQLVDDGHTSELNLLRKLIQVGIPQLFSTPDARRNPFDQFPLHSGDRLTPVVAILSHWAQASLVYAASGKREEIWYRLGRVVTTLFNCHYALEFAGTTESRLRMKLALRKSTLPFAAIALADTLTDETPVCRDLRYALKLGHVCGLIDDIVDFAQDSVVGEPTTLEQWLPNEGVPNTLSDAAAYRVLTLACQALSLRIGKLHAHARPYAEKMVRLWTGQGFNQCALPKARPRGPPSILSALDYLELSRRQGFHEAIHSLRMPRLDGSMEVHNAIVMQRSVIIDCLVDAEVHGYYSNRSAICSEAIELLKAKNAFVRGGWSYVQTVPELPPDADDLGQVLLALSRVGGKSLAETCDEAIRLCLNEQHADGGIPTWILDSCRTDANNSILRYLPIMGGWGIHPEVVANLACGLVSYNYNRFSECIVSMQAYIMSNQMADGHWDSKWYCGPFYGTLKCLQAISTASDCEHGVNQALGFLRQRQNDDFSWGIIDGGDPLSTALAALGLLQVNAPSDEERLVQAVRWLISHQLADGSWCAIPWISFPFAGGHETYSSRVITTAFCVKALILFAGVYGRQALNVRL